MFIQKHGLPALSSAQLPPLALPQRGQTMSGLVESNILDTFVFDEGGVEV